MNCDIIFIFDFDGTLVKSNKIKSRLFEFVFPELSSKSIHTVVNTSKGNRYDIINVLDLKVSEDVRVFSVKDRIQIYDRISVDAVVLAKEVTGATQFLNALIEKRSKLYISSATPENIMIEIIKQRGWAKYFNGIYGSPATKQSHILNIRRLHSSAHKMIYFGDSEIDFRASTECNIDFIGMFTSQNKPDWFVGDEYSSNFNNLKTKMGME